jgi:enamine deaminase RidA (YjgF/YER057c/UK114 family)
MKRLNPQAIARPRGAYSQAVISDAGGAILWTAGQVAVDRSGKLVGKGDAEKQLRQIFANLSAILDEAGGSLADIVKLTTYDTNIPSHADAIRRVRGEVFGAELPASTKIEVQRLADPDYLLEVEAIAVLERGHLE